MHPYDHARSSAKLHGGHWQDYFAFHHHFDSSKSVFCHFTHRALMHHLEGVAAAQELFGEQITNSDGAQISTEALGHQHLTEDCRILPRAANWVTDFDPPAWLPNMVPAMEELLEDDLFHFGGDAEIYRDLHDWFYETKLWVNGPAWFLFRHHAFGVFAAEERFGPVLGRGAGPFIPTRVVAERHVQRVLGRIPPATDFLRRIRGERWMLQATSPRKLGLG